LIVDGVSTVTSPATMTLFPDFSITQSARQVHDDIVELKQKLMHAFDALARKQPVPSVGALIKALRKRR